MLVVCMATAFVKNDMLQFGSFVTLIALVILVIIEVHGRNNKLQAFCEKEHGAMAYVHARKANKCTIGGEEYWHAP